MIRLIAFTTFFMLMLTPQELTLRRSLKLPGGVDYFTADQFGNIYLVSGDEIIKTDVQGKKLYAYSDPLYGDISNVDALNAMNPLLFYNDVNQLRILDNRLNETRSYNLLEAGFVDPYLVAYSDENNIWIYDQVSDRLVRYNLRTEKITAQSLVITQLTGSENRPEALFSSFDKVLLQVPGKGMMIFDAQASYIRNIKIPDSVQVSFDNNTIYTLSAQGGLRQFNLAGNEEQPLILPEQNTKHFFTEGKRLYLMREKQLQVYHLNE